MRQFIMTVFVAAMTVLGASTTARAGDAPAGHVFGEWPALSAYIPHEDQKNLDLGDKDFLIEIWFKPLAVLKYKGNTPNVLISKKCADALPGYTLAYQGENVLLTLCDKRSELEQDRGFAANAGLKEGQWCVLAVTYSHKDKKIVFYKDGKSLKAFKDVELGDLSNKDPFNIGYYENLGNSQAHCEIKQARLYTFAKALPDDIAAMIASHNKSDWLNVMETAQGKFSCSCWFFIPLDETARSEKPDDIKDLGNNGNKLVYTPWGVKEAFKIKAFPAKPEGKTYYVDAANAAATDEGEGAKDKPFKTIHRGTKAAGPGDVLHICKGVYRETIVPRAGENGKPVTVEGEEGAIICGSDPITGWQPAGEGLWRVTGWKGQYQPPSDIKERDERSNPGHLLFVDGYPLDYVKTKAELVAGTWNVEPVLGYGPKTITICPLPNVDPTKAPVEITQRGGLVANKFTHVKGLHFFHGGVALRGIGNVLENNTIEWDSYCTLGVYGQYYTVRSNTIRWGGNTGLAGSTYALTLEKNLVECNGWRNFYGGWGGGAIKFIPSNLDHVMRHNEFRYNQIACIWYDSNNQGNLIEGNKVHDNATGGFFDEFCFGNTIQYNLFYNNMGGGIAIANTAEDRVYRNIVYNCGGGLFFRYGPKVKNSPEKYASEKAEFGGKFDVRRYQGIIPYERVKKYRDALDKYTFQYPEGSIVGGNQIIENVLFNDTAWGGQEVNQPNNYANRASVDPDQVSTFTGNIYWNDRGEKIFNNGTYCTRDWTFKEWQGFSGQDKDGRWMDPLANLDKMPSWFKERFPFKKGDFRPLDEVMDKYIPTVKGGVAKTVLMSRLLRSKRIEKVKFADPMLFGYYFDADGKPCVSLWSRAAGARELLAADAGPVTLENRFMQRKELTPADGRLSLYIGEDPVTLIGLEGQIREDRSVLIDVPQWTEPGKSVPAKIVLENIGAADKEYDLKVAAGERWKVTPDSVKKTLKSGQRIEVPVELCAVEDIRQGAFKLQISGAAGGKPVSQSRNFGIGVTMTLEQVEHTPKLDGDFAGWMTGGLKGEALNKEQVVAGKENWKGPDDLSAKAYLSWSPDRELFIAIDVDDDVLVTNHRDDNPAKSDSVELFVDVRSPWKQYMKQYTPGVFKIIFVPGDGKSKATFKYETQTFGDVSGVSSVKTAKGYRIMADVHFHGGEVEDPGWVAGREVRIGLLVHDADDAAGKNRKSIGVWRTAADAGEDCTSLTTFVTKKTAGE